MGPPGVSGALRSLRILRIGRIGSGLIGKHASTYIFAKFSAETNTRGNKTPTTCIPFHTNYDYKGRWKMNEDLKHNL